MSHDIKIDASTGIPGVKVTMSIDADSYTAIESHYQNVSLHTRALRNGDTESIDAIAPLFEMDCADARAASILLLRQAAKCPDRKARMALKRLSARGTRTLR